VRRGGGRRQGRRGREGRQQRTAPAAKCRKRRAPRRQERGTGGPGSGAADAKPRDLRRFLIILLLLLLLNLLVIIQDNLVHGCRLVLLDVEFIINVVVIAAAAAAVLPTAAIGAAFVVVPPRKDFVQVATASLNRCFLGKLHVQHHARVHVVPVPVFAAAARVAEPRHRRGPVVVTAVVAFIVAGFVAGFVASPIRRFAPSAGGLVFLEAVVLGRLRDGSQAAGDTRREGTALLLPKVLLQATQVLHLQLALLLLLLLL